VNIKDNTDAELDAFDEVCNRLGGFNDRVVAAEWVDGYLTALAAGPRAVDIDEWLPRMAGDAFERAFGDPEDADKARAALLARTRILAHHLDPEALLDNPEEPRVQPLVALWDEAARQKLVDEQQVPAEDAAQLFTGALWAEGFIDATQDFLDDWQNPADVEEEDLDVLGELLTQVGILVVPEDHDDFKAHIQTYWADREATRDDLLNEAVFAVQDLRVWWLDHAPRPAPRHVDPTPGRNDPCPCGSGQKYKKCHGKAA
jgi:uncharacterized protein